MARTILLTTLALMTAFAGCIGDESSSQGDAFVDDAPDESLPQANVAPATQPGCRANTNSSNHGTMFTYGEHTIKSEDGGLTWYEDTNGVRGIQTEEACPSNPDTKYVDLGLW